MSSLLSTVLFADDTTIFLSDPFYNNLIEVANIELIKLSNWMIDNKLSINLEKTFAILFSNKAIDHSTNVLKLNNKIVDVQNTGKFLGVTIDNRLTFKHHVSVVCTKLSKTVGIFLKLYRYIPEKNLINLYYSFVYPYILYCNQVWEGCAQNHLNSILLLQKKVIRLITKKDYLAHTDPLFKRTGILKVNDVYI